MSTLEIILWSVAAIAFFSILLLDSRGLPRDKED